MTEDFVNVKGVKILTEILYIKLEENGQTIHELELRKVKPKIHFMLWQNQNLILFYLEKGHSDVTNVYGYSIMNCMVMVYLLLVAGRGSRVGRLCVLQRFNPMAAARHKQDAEPGRDINSFEDILSLNG